LTLYQLAAEQTWQLPVEKLTLYHFRTNTPCSCRPRDGVQLNETKRLVLEIAEGIAQQKFPAIENQYCPCDFPEYCPYYRQQYMIPELAQPAILDGVTVTETVEHYVSLQNQIKELQSQFEGIRQQLIDFCQTEGLNRVYGSAHAITYKLVEKTGFNEDDVRALLECEGLWYKVLSLDQSRLRQLIADEMVTKDVREKLETLRQVISAYPQLWVKKVTEEE